MAILARSPKAGIFYKKVQRGTEPNFLKIAQNVNFDYKAQKQSGANGIIL